MGLKFDIVLTKPGTLPAVLSFVLSIPAITWAILGASESFVSGTWLSLYESMDYTPLALAGVIFGYVGSSRIRRRMRSLSGKDLERAERLRKLARVGLVPSLVGFLFGTISWLLINTAKFGFGFR